MQHYDIVTQEGFRVCELSVTLTRSQQENYRIIRRHWQGFNAALRRHNLQSGKDWRKYGMTLKFDERYRYLCAIPYRPGIEAFETREIDAGRFARFQHRGSMQAIAATVYEMYTQTIPESDLEIDLKRRLVHYELYDRRFHWNRSDSTIDIYVPIVNNFQG